MDVFVDHGLIKPSSFQLRSKQGLCLTANDQAMALEECGGENKQRFFWTRNKERMQNLGKMWCLDAASPRPTVEQWSAPILFPCMPRNKNQQWTFRSGRLVWGSYCMDYTKDVLQ